MGNDVKQDIDRFFRIFEARTEKLMSDLPTRVKKDLSDEIALLRASVLNRLEGSSRR